MKTSIGTMWRVVLATSLLQFAVFAEEGKAPPKEETTVQLPNVLIIGDSISIGYTEPVKKLLEGKANVSRVPGNCQDSGTGVKNAQKWVGEKKWDVIHFNFGIWDTHLLHHGQLVQDRSKYKAEELQRRHTTEQYVENLRKIVATLKKTDAKLIWASTTPYVSYGEDTKLLVEENNKAARELMDKEGVAVNDLYSLVLPKLKEWQSGDGCHFNGLGSGQMARQVASTVSNALSEKAKPPKEAKDPKEPKEPAENKETKPAADRKP